MNKHRIVIVGFGGMGAQHADMIDGVAELELAGTFDVREVRQEQARLWGYHAYPSFAAVLADKSVDSILIATPNHIHRDIAIQAMEAGKHVICDKPVTLNSQELKDILAASQKTGKVFMVHQNRRWDEDYLSIKKLVDEGTLGHVFRVETRVQGSRGIPGDWRREKQFGGGMLLDWGVHLLDRLLLLFPAPVKLVYCKLMYPTGKEVDEEYHIHLTFADGRTAIVETGTRDYIMLPKWYALGTTGTAIITDWQMGGKVTLLVDDDETDAQPIVAGAGLTKTMAPRVLASTKDEPLPRVATDVRDFYRNFVAVTEGKAEPIVKNDQVLRVMRLIEAAFESDRTGQAVRFE